MQNMMSEAGKKMETQSAKSSKNNDADLDAYLVHRLVVRKGMLYQVTVVKNDGTQITDGMLLSPFLQIHELKTIITSKFENAVC